MRKAGRRGFLMILVLFLSVILVTLGLGYLGSRVGQYQSTFQSLQAAQARCLARSGIEDARAKLNRDLLFPIAAGVGENVFTYSEDVSGRGGSYVGSYQVAIDTTYSKRPYAILSVTSTGQAGPRGAPTSTHTYRAAIDMAPQSPLYFTIIRWDDLGGL